MGLNKPLARFDTWTVLQVEVRATQDPWAEVQVQEHNWYDTGAKERAIQGISQDGTVPAKAPIIPDHRANREILIDHGEIQVEEGIESV